LLNHLDRLLFSRKYLKKKNTQKGRQLRREEGKLRRKGGREEKKGIVYEGSRLEPCHM
jgi:hypothetical protein